MENINKCDECDEQENCKNDANNQPCRNRACSFFKDSIHNIGSDLNPTYKGRTFGNVSTSFFLGCILNAVYNVDNNCILGNLNICLNLIDECFFINRFGQCILICENEGTIFAAYNTYENQICRSSRQFADVVAGDQVGSQSGACGNGDNDCVNIAICANLFIAILIGVGNGVSGVANNLDQNAGIIGHYKGVGVVDQCDNVTLLNTVNGFVNLNDSSITISEGYNSNNVGFGISGCRYITIDEDVGLMLYLNTIEINGAFFDEIAKGVIGERLGLIKVFPNVACLLAINCAYERSEEFVAPLSNRAGNSQYILFVFTTTNVEVYGDGALAGINPIQIEVLGTNGFVGNRFCAIPEPVIGVIIAGLYSLQSVYIRFVEDRVLYGQFGLRYELTTFKYIIVNEVSGCCQIVDNGYGFSGHCEITVKLNTVESCLFVYKTSGHMGSRLIYTLDLITSFVVTTNGNGVAISTDQFYDGIVYAVGNSVCYIFTIVNGQIVLVNDGNFGEVRSIEGDVGCVDGNNGIIQLFAVQLNKGLNTINTVLTCERQNNGNDFAIFESNIFANTVKGEVNLVRFRALILVCVIGYVRIVETDLVYLFTGQMFANLCLAFKQCKSVLINSDRLCIAINSCQNKTIESLYNFSCKFEVESCNTLFIDQFVPVLCKGDGEIVVFVKVDFKINACYEIANLNSSLFCVLVKRNDYINDYITLNSVYKIAVIELVIVCIAEKSLLSRESGIEFLCFCIE